MMHSDDSHLLIQAASGYTSQVHTFVTVGGYRRKVIVTQATVRNSDDSLEQRDFLDPQKARDWLDSFGLNAPIAGLQPKLTLLPEQKARRS